MTKTLDALQVMLAPSDKPFTGMYKPFTPTVVCADGTTLSVQASRAHYSSPREDTGPYTAVEVGFPSDILPALLKHAENSEEDPTRTVYGFVPIEVVAAAIDFRGGLKEHNPNPSEKDRLRAEADSALGRWLVAKTRLDNLHKAYLEAHEQEKHTHDGWHNARRRLWDHLDDLRYPANPTPTPEEV